MTAIPTNMYNLYIYC